MMATMKYREARGAEADTAFYGFYVRTTGETREMLTEARRKLAGRFGAPPSNPLLLTELLRLYVAQETPERINGTQMKTQQR